MLVAVQIDCRRLCGAATMTQKNKEPQCWTASWGVEPQTKVLLILPDRKQFSFVSPQCCKSADLGYSAKCLWFTERWHKIVTTAAALAKNSGGSQCLTSTLHASPPDLIRRPLDRKGLHCLWSKNKYSLLTPKRFVRNCAGNLLKACFRSKSCKWIQNPPGKKKNVGLEFTGFKSQYKSYCHLSSWEKTRLWQVLSLGL